MNLQVDVQMLLNSGLSLEQIAVKFRVSSMTVYRWWKGDSKPNDLVVEKINKMANRARELK